MDEEHLKQRKKDKNLDGNKENIDKQQSLSEDASSVATISDLSIGPELFQSVSSSSVPKVTQTKEEYFEALRQWLQQVQMQQTALTYFPYYLASNYQQMTNNGIGGLSQQYQSPASFYFPTQYTMFPQTSVNGSIPGFNLGTAAAAAAASQQPSQSQTQSQQQQQQQPGGQQPPPVFLNNIFQQNRNHFNDNTRRNTEVIQQNGGYEYVIAPIWKRFAAETIDVLILFVIKVMAAFMIIDIFDIDFGIDLDFDSLKTSLEEEDYTDFLTLSSDLLLVEIITKILVCFYEAIWTAQGQTFVGGATPGKMIMGLRILYVEGVVPLEPFPPGINFNNTIRMRALLYPAANPGFRRALLRAVAKNMLLTLMFPMCFILLFFRNNRTGYDVMTKTIVVEENAAPTLRRL